MDACWLKTQFELNPNKTKASLALALHLEPPAISKILSGSRQIKAPEYIFMRGFFGLPADGEKATGGTDKAFVVDPLDNSQNEFQEHTNTPESQWIIPSKIVKQHTSSNDIKNFRVADNMMAPEFNRDEHVLVDLSDCAASPPGSFIISDGYSFMLRNCEIIPQSNPVKIKISALKQSFQPQKVAMDEVEIIGRVVAKLQWL